MSTVSMTAARIGRRPSRDATTPVMTSPPSLTSPVVTVEPGVYLPDIGGVRIEDTVVVTADGCRALTKSPKDLIAT